MILGLHVCDSANVGDIASTPLDYFALGADVVTGDLRSPPHCEPSVVVYGGGSITASHHFRRWPCLTIAWGVGHHIRTPPWHDRMLAEHERAAELCDLYFPRDCVPGFEDVWTPCASCMHPVFDEVANIEPAHKVVRYSAARRVSVDDGSAPHADNETGTIEDAVRFLASGETVVTSSYHGAYWAHLLGRKVEMVRWGSKFEYVPQLGLQEARDLNLRTFQRVLDAVNG